MDGQHSSYREHDPASPGATKGKGRPLSTIWADDYTLNLDAGGVVDGLIPLTGKTVLYGESGCGKTFTAIDLACHVACGRPWRGKDVEQGIVVYVAAEAPESVKRRLWAWKRHHGVDHLPVVVVQSTVDLLNGDADAVAELVQEVAREHGRVALVVVDTLARAMTGNENTPDDMGKFVAACSRIGEAGDTHVMIVHHSGKDQARGARGHSSLRAATDVELEVVAGEVCGWIKVTKSRDDESGNKFCFALETVELGVNAKGRAVTTCVAVEHEVREQPDRPGKKDSLGDNEKLVLDILAATICDKGRVIPPSHGIPLDTMGCRFEEWEAAAERYMPPGKSAFHWRRDFKRAVGSLRTKHRYKLVDGWCWLPKKPEPAPHLPVSEWLSSDKPSHHPTHPTASHGMMGCSGHASSHIPHPTPPPKGAMGWDDGMETPEKVETKGEGA